MEICWKMGGTQSSPKRHVIEEDVKGPDQSGNDRSTSPLDSLSNGEGFSWIILSKKRMRHSTPCRYGQYGGIPR